MKHTHIPTELSASIISIFCKTVLTALFPIALMLFSAIVDGDFPLLPGIVVGLALLLLANTLCGAVTPAGHLKVTASAHPVHHHTPRTVVPCRAARPAVALRVVHGGHAA